MVKILHFVIKLQYFYAQYTYSVCYVFLEQIVRIFVLWFMEVKRFSPALNLRLSEELATGKYYTRKHKKYCMLGQYYFFHILQGHFRGNRWWRRSVPRSFRSRIRSSVSGCFSSHTTGELRSTCWYHLHGWASFLSSNLRKNFWNAHHSYSWENQLKKHVMVSEVIKWCIINIIRGSSFLMNLLLLFGLSTVHLQLRKVAFANQESISREIIAGHSGHFI